MEQEKNDDIKTDVLVRYSGFWVRLAAHIIDGFVISVGSMVILIPLNVFIAIFAAFDPTTIIGTLGQIIAMIAGIFLGWTYHIYMIHRYGATLGKMSVGVQVRSENNMPLETNAIIMRETVGKMASLFSFFVGYLMIAFTAKKQGLHDVIGKTVVVYKDPVKGPNVLIVWMVYVIHILFIMACTMIIAMIIFVVFFFIDRESGSGEDQWEDPMPIDELFDVKNVITDTIQQS